MTMLEVAIAMPIVLVALGLFVQMVVAGTDMRSTSQEGWACSSAAQTVVEDMRNEAFRDLFLMYNADPLDDPGGPGTAPGNRFDVAGLDPVPAGPDEPPARVGEIVLPFWNSGTELSPAWQVREDLLDAALGAARDLNGDAIIDALDHAADYTFLPVIVRLRWQGLHGPRQYEIHTALSELR